MAKVEVRCAYAYDSDKVSHETGIRFEDPSLAIQSQAEEADINTIVKRFGLTGQLPTNVRVPLTEDFVETFDFRSAMDTLNAAQKAFMSMPASVRGRFENDPAKFVEFVSDERNLEESIRMGLAIEVPPVPKSATLDDVVAAVKASKPEGK